MAALAKEPPKETGFIAQDLYLEDLPPDINSGLDLLKTYSGIPAAQVEQHVFEMRAKAWAIFPYPCVGLFEFLDITIKRHPFYPTLLAKLQKDTSATVLDMGCCMAQDLRQLSADGVPSQNLFGTDLRLEFLELGYELFRDRESMKATFVAGDALATAGTPDAGDLHKLDGRINFVNAMYFIHLFGWDDQVAACVRMVKFFKPDAEDAVVFGMHLGATQPGNVARPVRDGGIRFSHNPATFQELWDVVGEKTGTKWKVTASLRELGAATTLFSSGSSHDVKLLVFEVHKVLSGGAN